MLEGAWWSQKKKIICCHESRLPSDESGILQSQTYMPYISMVCSSIFITCMDTEQCTVPCLSGRCWTVRQSADCQHKLRCSRYVGFLRDKARPEPCFMQAISFVRDADNCSDHWFIKVLDTSMPLVLQRALHHLKANGKVFAGSSSIYTQNEWSHYFSGLVSSQHCHSLLPWKQDT